MDDDERQDRTINDAGDVPVFASEAEEADFWSDHELGGDLLARMERPPEGLLPRPRARATPISMRIEPDLLASLKEEAARRHMPYQTLLKQLVTEQLRGASDAPAAEARAGTRPAPIPVSADDLADTFPRLTDQPRARRHAQAVRKRGHVLEYAA